MPVLSKNQLKDNPLTQDFIRAVVACANTQAEADKPIWVVVYRGSLDGIKVVSGNATKINLRDNNMLELKLNSGIVWVYIDELAEISDTYTEFSFVI